MNRQTHPHGVHPAVVKQQYDTHNVWDFENRWRTELFKCSPVSRCCFSCFCCCFMGCKLAKHMGESKAIGCCLPCSLTYMRTKLRTARRIEGNCCGDCCASTCCFACTSVQVSHELESQGMWEVSKPSAAKRSKNAHHDQQPTRYGNNNSGEYN